MKLSSHKFSKLLAISLFSLSFAFAENAPEVTPLGNESLETLISKTSELKGLQTPGSYFKALVYASENVDKSDVIVQI